MYAVRHLLFDYYLLTIRLLVIRFLFLRTFSLIVLSSYMRCRSSTMIIATMQFRGEILCRHWNGVCTVLADFEKPRACTFSSVRALFLACVHFLLRACTFIACVIFFSLRQAKKDYSCSVRACIFFLASQITINSTLFNDCTNQNPRHWTSCSKFNCVILQR